MWIFLRDWRATIISAAALPLAIIPTFWAMYLLGYTLNLLTLLALSLVVGMLVDDAIVEVENIVRHLRNGKKPLEAATDAAIEIGLAVIATTLTLCAVFVPVAFMGGVPGEFFRPFAFTAAVAVMFSLLVARMLTPMMAAYMLKPHAEPNEDSWIKRKYLVAIEWCLRTPAQDARGCDGSAGRVVRVDPVHSEGLRAGRRRRVRRAAGGIAAGRGARRDDAGRGDDSRARDADPERHQRVQHHRRVRRRRWPGRAGRLRRRRASRQPDDQARRRATSAT